MWWLFYTKFMRSFAAPQGTKTRTGIAGTQELKAGEATLPAAGSTVIVIAEVRGHKGGGHCCR
jgi:hypothetical protein